VQSPAVDRDKRGRAIASSFLPLARFSRHGGFFKDRFPSPAQQFPSCTNRFLKKLLSFSKKSYYINFYQIRDIPEVEGGGWKTVNHVRRAFEETPVCVHPAPEKSNYLSA
jgi:hypothetical protein